jgi:hypothetical protein
MLACQSNAIGDPRLRWTRIRDMTHRAPLLSLIVATAALVAPAASQAALHCPTGSFTADVRHGPDTDLSLTGRLDGFRVSDSGAVTGHLTHYGKSLKIRGQISGRTVKLAFSLRGGLTLRGSGHAKRTIRTCADLAMTGAAHGPRHGDRGRWGIIWGS